MKTRTFFAAALLAALLPSCKENLSITPSGNESSGDPVSLGISIETPATKALIERGSTADMSFHSAQVFVYNSAGQLEKTSGIVETQDVSLSVVPGHKTVWVVVNAPSAISGVDSLQDFPAARTSLSDNTPGSLVMCGSAEVDAVTARNLSVTVKHVAAKIVIEKISRSFENAAYAEVPMTIKKMYMSNVAADADFGLSTLPSQWICKLGVLSAEPENAELLLDDGIDAPLSEGGAYTQSHTFYVYPNPVGDDSDAPEWTPRKTRLVIACEYNGKPCYYPISIPGSSFSGASGTVQGNKVYRISSLTLTRPGSESTESKEPEVSSEADCTFSIVIADWEEEDPYTEVF